MRCHPDEAPEYLRLYPGRSASCSDSCSDACSDACSETNRTKLISCFVIAFKTRPSSAHSSTTNGIATAATSMNAVEPISPHSSAVCEARTWQHSNVAEANVIGAASRPHLLATWAAVHVPGTRKPDAPRRVGQLRLRNNG